MGRWKVKFTLSDFGGTRIHIGFTYVSIYYVYFIILLLIVLKLKASTTCLKHTPTLDHCNDEPQRTYWICNPIKDKVI